jgi:hypothetical protein
MHLAAFETRWLSLLDMGRDRLAEVVGQIELHWIGEGHGHALRLIHEPAAHAHLFHISGPTFAIIDSSDDCCLFMPFIFFCDSGADNAEVAEPAYGKTVTLRCSLAQKGRTCGFAGRAPPSQRSALNCSKE